jgi:hypothetical protein
VGELAKLGLHCKYYSKTLSNGIKTVLEMPQIKEMPVAKILVIGITTS